MTGGPAPHFDLPGLAGERCSLRDLLQSGPVLLVFFKVTCPTCQLTFPFLERLHRAAKPGAPRIISISQDDAAATRDFNNAFGVTFSTLLDPSAGGPGRYPASNAYRITNVPTLFLVEPDGNISQAVAGFDKAEMEKLAARFGVQLFAPSDRVPVFRPG